MPWGISASLAIIEPEIIRHRTEPDQLLHSGLMIREMPPGLLKILLLLPLALVATFAVAAAEEAGTLQVDAQESVIYAQASVANTQDLIAHELKDGIPVTTEWNLSVARTRNYWLNASIADIHVIRKVVPDLLSKSWQLVDETSGISHRSFDINEAIRFLSSLDHYPLLDRSLLTSGPTYVVKASIEFHTGGINKAWWSKLWPSEFASLRQEFSLP